MDETIGLFEKFEWFIKPVSKIIYFLFTTKTGFILLVGLITIYFLSSLINSLYLRRLVHQSAKSSRGNGKVSIIERFYLFISETGRTISKIGIILTLLIGVLLILTFITEINSGMKNNQSYFDELQKVKNLRKTIRQIDRKYKFGEIQIVEIDYNNPAEIRSNLIIKYFDVGINGFSDNTQKLALKGNDIYIDAKVLNFEYSEITNGQQKLLLMPFRIYSNMVAVKEAMMLNSLDNDSIAFIYHRSKSDIYCIHPDDYESTVKEVSKYFYNNDLARSMGVRTYFTEAVHLKVNKGDILSIYLDPNSGLQIKNQYMQ